MSIFGKRTRGAGICVVIALALFCGGCAAVREARVAQQEGASLPGERTVTPAEAGLAAGDGLSLARAQDVALTWHPALLQATQQVAAARIALHQAGGGLRPALDGSVGYGGKTQGVTDGPWRFDASDELTAGLSLSWVLYDFGRTRAAQREAVAGLLAACEQLRQTRVQRVYEVRGAYFDLARAEALYEVSVDSRRQYAEQLEQARAFLEVGRGRRYDVTKAEVDLGNADLAMITASNLIATTRAELDNRLGFGQSVEYVLDAWTHLAELPESVDALMALARTNQPALAVLRAREQAASAAVDQAVAERYPEVSLRTSADFAERGAQVLTFSWAVSLVQNLFDGWRRDDTIRAKVTLLREARSRVAQQEQSVCRDLAVSLAELRRARESRDVAAMLERQARENLDLVNEQFRVGVSSALERTDAQAAHTKARAELVAARFALERAQASLHAVVGL